VVFVAEASPSFAGAVGMVEPTARIIGLHIGRVENFSISRLTDIRKIIARPESVDQARAVLAEHFGAHSRVGFCVANVVSEARLPNQWDR